MAIESALVVGVGWGEQGVVCAPPSGGDTHCLSPLVFLLWRALHMVPYGCCLLGDILAPLQQLDHGCHLSVRQLMSLHLVSKFKRCRM